MLVEGETGCVIRELGMNFLLASGGRWVYVHLLSSEGGGVKLDGVD